MAKNKRIGKSMKKIVIILFILTSGTIGLVCLNKNLLMIWNANEIVVNVGPELSKEQVKIEHGISVHNRNRANDLALFENRAKYAIVFDGEPKRKIENEYGENDFLITYNNYYLSFRHFKLNRRHQHTYRFDIKKGKDQPIVSVKIEGKDGMSFSREMINLK